MTTASFVITFLVYIVAGSIPPLLAHFLLRVRFLGGPWAASLVGTIGAVVAGLVDTIFLTTLGDLIVIAGAVDLVPPIVGSVVLTAVYGLVSSSNS